MSHPKNYLLEETKMEKYRNSNPTVLGRLFATVFAMIIAVGMSACPEAGLSGYENLPQTAAKAAAPVPTPASGATFEETLSVTLATVTEEATIHNTLDGSDPTEGTEYSGAITISEDTTLKAIAVMEDAENNSIVISAQYTKGLQAPPPTAE
jgi:hypothetical protein